MILEEEIAEALRLTAGVYSAAGERLGCTGQNISMRVAGSPVLQEVVTEVNRRLTDHAKGNVITAMNERVDGKPTKQAVKVSQWWLERKAKDEGFSTRQEVTGADGAPLVPNKIEVEVSYVDPKGDVL